VSRPWSIWIGFGLCLSVVLGALLWLTVTVLGLEKQAADARRQAAYEESVRLALWRMDSALAPVLRATHPLILLSFELYPQGSDNSVLTPGAGKTAATSRTREFLQGLDFAALNAALPTAATDFPIQPLTVAQTNQPMQQQMMRNVQETQARQRAVQQSNDLSDVAFGSADWFGDVPAGPWRPLWFNDKLLLARRVPFEDGAYLQGCWLDWPGIQQLLAGEIRDLFATPRFAPRPAGAADPRGRALAALPILFEPGPAVGDFTLPASPLRAFLITAWAGVLLAALAVGVLLRGIVALSERRAVFVSAVTHELRTPLTTFRLYTDLLGDERVADGPQRQQYMQTLRTEALRLTHLVENVLAYARLERGRATALDGAVQLCSTLERARERLAERAAQAQLDLVWDVDAAGDVVVRATDTALEQILFNLVDNACKYAATADDRRIEVHVQRRGDRLVIGVRDHGPGIPPADARRLFRPFHKSARAAAHSAPGVGLGLALARRLARSLGGDLRLVSGAGPGACFELWLRSAPADMAGSPGIV